MEGNENDDHDVRLDRVKRRFIKVWLRERALEYIYEKNGMLQQYGFGVTFWTKESAGGVPDSA